MEFDLAWCPACDKQIEPKRRTINVPVTTNNNKQQPPPPPPSSPRKSKGTVRQKAGLVNGTGRLRHNGTIKPTSPPVALKQRLIIDQGPAPLYCSDECQFADINTRRRSAPIDPAREEPSGTKPARGKSSKKSFTTVASGTDSDDASSSDSLSSPPAPPMTSMDKFAAMYNFTLPQTPGCFEPEPVIDYDPPQYNSGIMMAGRLINSLCPLPTKPHEGRYRPAQEPRKLVPGWTDGSHAWRSAVYSFSPTPKFNKDPFGREPAAKPLPSRRLRPTRSYSLATLPNLPSLSASDLAADSASDHMMSKFSENFSRRSQSRTSLYAGGGATASPISSSAPSTHSLPLSPKRERSIVPPGAEGKLLVPDVKLKVRSGSSASLSSTWSSSAPGSSTSRRSARSPLGLTTDSDEDTERCVSKDEDNHDAVFNTMTSTRPVETTRSWSYDNVQTYPMMPMVPKKVKKLEKQIVEGEEKMVEVEVEEYPEFKRLFLFAPTRVSTP